MTPGPNDHNRDEATPLFSPPMTLPASRALLGWWQELQPLKPRRLWFAHLVLHRLETLVEVTTQRPLAPLTCALLERIAALGPIRPEEPTLAPGLDRGLLLQAVDELQVAGCVTRAHGQVQATAAGKETLSRTAPNGQPGQERRTFFFTDSRPPLFIPLNATATTPLQPPAGWQLDLAVLEECLARPAEWKTQHGFPSEVLRLLRPSGPITDPNQVPFGRAEQAVLVLVQTTDGDLLAYPTRTDNWTLSKDSAFSLPGGMELVPPLVGEVGPDALRAAWVAWSQLRSLPSNEVEACKLELDDVRLIVRAPTRLMDRLRITLSDSLRGEAWVLAGTGRVRPAFLLAPQVDA